MTYFFSFFSIFLCHLSSVSLFLCNLFSFISNLLKEMFIFNNLPIGSIMMNNNLFKWSLSIKKR